MLKDLSSLHCRVRNRGRRSRSAVLMVERLDDRTLPSTLTVVNNLDSGWGSLRKAITDASSGDTIATSSRPRSRT